MPKRRPSACRAWYAHFCAKPNRVITSRMKPAASAPLLSVSLRIGKLAVKPAASHELVVRSLLDDAAVVQNDDEVGVADRREPVRDHEGGTCLHHLLERIEDDPFCLRVDRRGRLVEDENRRI